tara:strand:+ start:1129 stop:1386 length:258 start_codon:yes stop_codon:yes gene_type:complete
MSGGFILERNNLNIVELIKPDDPQYFTLSSEEIYDRHHYRVVSKTGDTVIVDNWEDANIIWWNKKALLSHIDVLDKSKPKSKGFS